ncbi:MAG: hypothetical protein AB1898_29340 [Acidobacteriota bacterium]
MRYPLSKLARAGGLITSLFLLTTLIAPGKDFWEEKPYTQWNEQETIRMLTDSPWARSQTVLAGSLGAGQTDADSRITDLPNVATASGGRSSGAALSNAGVSFEANSSVPVYVRWYSSAKIREALGRLGQLQQNVPEGEVKRFVEQPQTDYLFAVVAPVMNSFNALSTSDFAAKTYLRSKKNKGKRIPLKAYSAPKDRPDGMAIFAFERQPEFGPEDEEVEFVAEGGTIRIKASFKLNKMTTDGKLDL